MSKFKSIKLQDKPIFDKYFNNNSYNNSEKNFSNLFMWKDYYSYKYQIINDNLCIIGKYKGENFAYIPYGEDIADTIQILEDDFENLYFFPVLENHENSLNSYKINKLRGLFDYVYSTDKLINLKGSNLRNKWRWIKRFMKNTNIDETINKANLKEAQQFLLNQIYDNQNEKIAMKKMFDNFFKLNIKGCILRVKDEIIGVSTGEELTKDTVLIHSERCDKEFDEAYNVINQDFVKNQWSDYSYINVSRT